MTYMTTMSRTATAVCAATWLTVAGSAAMAQHSGDGAQTTPEGAAQMNADQAAEMAAGYDDQTLESFVGAAISVAQLRDSYAQQISQAASEDEARELVVQATEEMRGAVENAEGISVETYMEIGAVAQVDESFAARLTEMVKTQIDAEAPSEG